MSLGTSGLQSMHLTKKDVVTAHLLKTREQSTMLPDSKETIGLASCPNGKSAGVPAESGLPTISDTTVAVVIALTAAVVEHICSPIIWRVDWPRGDF